MYFHIFCLLRLYPCFRTYFMFLFLLEVYLIISNSILFSCELVILVYGFSGHSQILVTDWYWFVTKVLLVQSEIIFFILREKAFFLYRKL